MPANFLPTLKREIEELEAELSSDPRFVKLRKLRDVLEAYGMDALSGRPATPQVAGSKQSRHTSPDREKALALAKDLVKGRSIPTPTREIVKHAAEHGLTIPGKDPVSNMSAMLSNSPIFQSHGRSGWTLVDPAPTDADDAPSAKSDDSAEPETSVSKLFA